MKLQNVFRRVSQVSRGATDTVDGEESKVKTPGLLFGRALAELCGGDGQTDLPPPVCNMLRQLFQKGPGNCHRLFLTIPLVHCISLLLKFIIIILKYLYSDSSSFEGGGPYHQANLHISQL